MNYLLILFFLLLGFIFLNFLLPHFVKLKWKNSFLRSAEKAGKVFLTFDDGPDSSSTGKLLDILNKYNIKATFFVLGKNALKNPELIKRIINEGHTIGIHGSSHFHPWKVTPWKTMLELSEGKKILRSFGINVQYVRPPYGKLNSFSLLYIWINKLIFVHWNVDPRDYDKENLKLNKTLQNEITTGKVILLHDGRIEGASPVNTTLNAIVFYFENMSINPGLFSALNSDF